MPKKVICLQHLFNRNLLKMKNYIFLVVFLILSIATFSQNPYTAEANSQLRGIFSQISYPDNNVLLLYDRSVKMSDSTFYSNNSPDTLNNQIWKQVYEEVYYSAHDTLPFQTLPYIQDYSTQFYGDTIPIALMDYDFYFCKEEAINTGNYFIFDTVNNVLYDHSNPIGSPYGRSNLFLGAAMKEFSNFANPVFRIDPNLFFKDNVNAPLYASATSVRINFDDGSGWHYFDLNVLTHYQANYSSEGRRIIQIELQDNTHRTIKSSKSDFMVLKSVSAVEPDEILDMEGLQVGVFNGCGNSKDGKIIIYLEGIDILDMKPAWGRGLDDIYHDMINSRYIEELRNFNHTFYVVNWKSSRIDMRFNALHVVNLIETLKKKYKASREQFVVIGESMGGVIGRYALTFMESKDYQAGDYSAFFVDAIVPQNATYLALHPNLTTLGPSNRDSSLDNLMHKTRSLITLDSPHQGANIPLSIQHAYRKLFGMVIPSFQHVTSFVNLGLEGYAAKQLLIYHIDGKTIPLSNTSTYHGDPAHYIFYDQLKKMGNYPRYCKLIALSNGAMNGKNQKGILETRVPSDLLLDFSTQLYGRVFWIKIPLFKADLELRTNPQGSGTFYSAAVGNFTLNIKLKWFGVNINNNYGLLLSDNQIALNTKPYCVSAGGYFYTPIDIGGNTTPSSYNLSKNWLFNLFSYDLNVSNGCITLNSHVGWQGLASVNLDFSLCSNGTDFGFIPLQSGLDYGSGLNLPLNHNIMTENINTKLSRTPFDVIVAYPDGINQDHLNYRDELIYNVTGAPATNCQNYYPNGEYAYYDADLQNQCEVKRSFLCLEIGDEEMYLENWELNRRAKFQSEYDLHVNKRNPYYEYPSSGGTTPTLDLKCIYSKEAPFIISPTGFASFFSNQNGSPTGTGFVYANPQNLSLWEHTEKEMTVCVEDYAQGKSVLIDETTEPEEKNKDFLRLYPNPNEEHLLVVEYDLEATEGVRLSIVDIAGKTVLESELLEGGTNQTTLDLKGLKAGVYLFSLDGNNQKLVSRLIIQ